MPSQNLYSQTSYALVHYPDIDTSLVSQLRNKYDPQAGMVEPHITLVFPLPEDVGEQKLSAHFEDVLRGWWPFTIRLKGLLQSSDDYLFLTVAEGVENMIRLHEDLYAGMLSSYHRRDVPFIAHVTLGVFSEDPRRCSQVLIDTRRMELDYQCYVDRLNLVKINDDRSRILNSTEFLLGSSLNAAGTRDI